MRVNFNENKGITLIALVVTIIVLLILAGISVSMLTGQNGILNRASEAKEKTAAAQKEENETLNDYEKIMDKYTSNLPSTKETMPYLPDATKFEKVSGTDLNSGLVIREKATGSEYVWVEVPKTATVYPTAGINITKFTDEEYTKIEDDLHTYTIDYRNGTNYSDTYAKDETTGWFANEKEYNELKNKMLKSVYENGGFWVGRYEAGIEANRTASGDAVAVPLTKANLYPYTYVTRTQAKVLAEQVESGKYKSNVLFGVQWDLILAFMEKNGGIERKNIIEDSKNIGNCRDSEFKMKRGKYALYENYVLNTEWNLYDKTIMGFVESNCKKSTSRGNGILITTGASENTNIMNIYDIAGNVWEWTLENSNKDNGHCVARGGCFSDGSIGGGNIIPAVFRSYNLPIDNYKHNGFRVTIY